MGLTSQRASGPAPGSAPPSVLVRRWLERRAVVLAAAAAVFSVIFAVRQTQAGAADVIALFYVAPSATSATPPNPTAVASQNRPVSRSSPRTDETIAAKICVLPRISATVVADPSFSA